MLPGVRLPVPDAPPPAAAPLPELDGPLVSSAPPASLPLPVLCPDVPPIVSPPALVSPVLQAVVAAPPARAAARVRPPSPLQLMQESMHAARIGPGQPGYQQVGAIHVYQYAPGVVYDLYVSPSVATALLFPPGDSVKVGLFLPKTQEGSGGFTVTEKFAGDQPHSYDVITIHPSVEQGTYEASVLMHNGHVYHFRLIVGKKGMLTVRFTVPAAEPAP